MAKNPTISYSVTDIRVVIPKGKVATKNPDRFATVHGDFRNMDDSGKPTGDTLSFHSKEITVDMAKNPLTDIDVPNGILTLPAGERGRKASVGIDGDSVAALLASVREDAEAEVEAEPVTAE